jgi:hypothetical protein
LGNLQMVHVARTGQNRFDPRWPLRCTMTVGVREAQETRAGEGSHSLVHGTHCSGKTWENHGNPPRLLRVWECLGFCSGTHFFERLQNGLTRYGNLTIRFQSLYLLATWVCHFGNDCSHIPDLGLRFNMI